MIKNGAKALLKTIKADVKNLASVVIEISGSKWEQDESGRWLERKD